MVRQYHLYLKKNKNGRIELKMEQNLLIFNLIWTQMKIGAQHAIPAAPEGTQSVHEAIQAAQGILRTLVNGRDSLIVINQNSL